MINALAPSTVPRDFTPGTPEPQAPVESTQLGSGVGQRAFENPGRVGPVQTAVETESPQNRKEIETRGLKQKHGTYGRDGQPQGDTNLQPDLPNANVLLESDESNAMVSFSLHGSDGDESERPYPEASNPSTSESRPSLPADTKDLAQRPDHLRSSREIIAERRAGRPLSDGEFDELRELEARQREVIRHERSHATAGGAYTGAPHFEYTTGPDGKRYVTSGHVPIDAAPVPDNPQASIRKLQQVVRAALAPSDPSAQDRAVAARAQGKIRRAQVDLAREAQPTNSEQAKATAQRRAAIQSAFRTSEMIEAESTPQTYTDAIFRSAETARADNAPPVVEINPRREPLEVPDTELDFDLRTRPQAAAVYGQPSAAVESSSNGKMVSVLVE